RSSTARPSRGSSRSMPAGRSRRARRSPCCSSARTAPAPPPYTTENERHRAGCAFVHRPRKLSACSLAGARVRLPGTASTYSRPVLGATSTLRQPSRPFKVSGERNPATCGFSIAADVPVRRADAPEQALPARRAPGASRVWWTWMRDADQQPGAEAAGPAPLVAGEEAAASGSVVLRLLGGRVPAVLEPLRIRDFALLWAGQSVSMVGDGVYTVAIAWQVYALSNSPTALADRLDRRVLMIAGAALPGIAIGVLAGLAVGGALSLWHIWIVSAAVGAGRALAGPASGAFVPDIVPAGLLLEANSLAQLVRPLAMTLVGPALGGVLVAAIGTGSCFAVDAASFAAAVGTLLAIPSRPHARGEPTALLTEIREGFAFIRRHVWIWGTLGMATIWVLLIMGPLDVLVPYIVKNDLGGSARDLGLVFASGGVGAIAAAAVTGQRGLPARPLTWMLAGWGLACATIAGVALAASSWQAAVALLAFQALLTVSEIIWITLLQRFVPGRLLGRVRSLDWLLS